MVPPQSSSTLELFQRDDTRPPEEMSATGCAALSFTRHSSGLVPETERDRGITVVPPSTAGTDGRQRHAGNVSALTAT
jgi:hypothetical protein